MRQLVQLPDKKRAELLADALYVEGIDGKVDEARDGEFVVWVEDEARLDDARALLSAFEANPFDERFQRAPAAAAARRKEQQKQDKKRARPVNMRQRWQDDARGGMGPATFLLIGITTIVFVLTFPGIAETFGSSREQILLWMWFESDPRSFEAVIGWFSDIRSGQVWRLVTPIFAHASPDFSRDPFEGLLGLAHFAFNMWWLRDFGAQIERRQGTWFMILLVLLCAVFSNTAQYVVEGGRFLGMSGVVYGCFGYIWVRGKVDPLSGYGLASGVVNIMVLWFVFGFVGMMSIANWAHAGGLAMGAALGWTLGRWARRRPG